MLIIGITGTLGAGKGTIVEYLVKKHSLKHFSVRGYLTKLLTTAGCEVNRNSLVNKGNELRNEYGASYIAEEIYKIAEKSSDNCIIESLRTPAEVKSLKSKGKFTLFAIDADPKVRYGRIISRASETDRISFDEFIKNEKREMESIDPTKQNIAKCIKMADYTFINNNSKNDLYEKVEKIITKIV